MPMSMPVMILRTVGYVDYFISFSCYLFYPCHGGPSFGVPRTNAYGIETIRYTGHKLWQSLPLEIKESHTLTEFKRKIENIISTIATVDCAGSM